MLIQDILAAKRDGQALDEAAIRHFIQAVAENKAGDEQIGAFTMATAIHGMSLAETVALTSATRDSGRVMDYSALNLTGPVLDKHSTGGVGDPVSLILGPWLAACGAHVPMISGRGLGHTGGTLDKLESIPGYDVTPTQDTFARLVTSPGVAIVGQSADLAPADKRLYAVRDVTATVASLPLIVASILGKKLAENLDALVMDVKIGNGAFLSSDSETRKLASTIAQVATLSGTPTNAVLSDMNQTLATSAGNAVEVHECLAILKGERHTGRLLELTRYLAVEALLSGKLAQDREEAERRLDATLASGQVAERFAQMVAGLGGPTDLLERPSAYLASAPVIRDIYPADAGFVTAQDVKALGMLVVELGGGRRRAGDRIDHRVGLDHIAAIGSCVDAQTPLARLHAASKADADMLAERLRDAFHISAEKVDSPPLVHDVLTPSQDSLSGDSP
ncbi:MULTISPECIES: thymidine phosphorylase [Halomonas]|uniref:Thymidine phosphorylase n=1 Tax=Halomonas binhaiensis TaxID=2562282 RepID=A0A5C1NGZ0_9GAMM|nr:MULTISPECIES: thymidine phosphorylase [Halomonas]QEM82474.1 thymidine phosphorylase [Halomonas binhaiensis]